MPKSPATKLAVVGAQPAGTVPPPPGTLGSFGLDLWRSVVTAYEFSDAGSYQVLYQACAACDRAESCRAQIDQDGEMLRVGKTVRSHPLLRDELANRAFLCRALARLGLDLEPVRSGPGRPPGGTGWRGDR
jgi:hypothetical protein